MAPGPNWSPSDEVHLGTRRKASEALLRDRVQTRFDMSSGQVFTERMMRAKPWLRNTNWPSANINLRRDSRAGMFGASSLEDMVMREVLRNIRNVDPEALQGLPWQLAGRIWEEADKLELITTTLWRTFAAIYPEELRFRYHRASEIIPQQPLCDYVTDLSSDTFQWLTCLTISTLDCARVDIINISKLHNIVAIDICGSDLTSAGTDLVDDSVIRNWGRRATGTNASFSLLRVLILRNQTGVTARSLEYLSAFPSLALYGVRGCRLTEQDEAPGWTNADEHGVLKMVQRDILLSQTWDDPIRSCFLRSAALLSLERSAKPLLLPYPDAVTMSEGEPQSLADIPLLNFRLGSTSNDLLYSKHLIFFRCLRSEACCETSVVQALEASNQLQQDCENEKDRSSKKRKVRVGKQIDLGEFFEEVALPLHPPVLLREKVRSH